MEYIDIDKTQVPYEFTQTIAGTTYKFDVRYNASSDFFTVDLYKGDKILVYGEKIVYGKPLFDPGTLIANNKTVIIPKTPDYPSVIIIPWDLSQKETRVTYENLGTNVFLYVITEESYV